MVPQRYRFRLGQGPVSRLTLRVHVTQARSRNIRQWITSSVSGSTDVLTSLDIATDIRTLSTVCVFRNGSHEHGTHHDERDRKTDL